MEGVPYGESLGRGVRVGGLEWGGGVEEVMSKQSKQCSTMRKQHDSCQ